MIVYRRENGYGTIDANAVEWQLGRKLFEAQSILSQIEPGSGGKLEEIAHWFCRLVAEVGQLRADYSSLQHILQGSAEYGYDEEKLGVRVRYEVKRTIEGVYKV